ncbi:MAG: 3,4-dihydroxy-2-butanone-4-phosphate synthase [Phycisphaeraceae bacterium]|nr:3,4-dihydroxy-2-butanone-4-phosphate synthase [Phycisphaerales bacterium]MCB9842696.1 3,4-dihydroxy-2-butanone-4-phosphate synthase [Phycisphaeraceae bacterium]
MFSPIEDILKDIRAGKMVILVDDEGRENEGDLVLAAEAATPEIINHMIRFAGGYPCLSLTSADCDRLHLHPQAPDNTSVRGTPFTVSIDGHPKHGVGTGVSAPDRAKTIALAINPTTGPADFVKPGHINPLRSRDGGVLVRLGQTEGAVDLARLAGCYPAAVIIELVREDGEMARRPDIEKMSAEHGIKVCTIDQIIAYRLQRETLIRRVPPVAGTEINTELGTFNLIAYESVVDPLPHLALTVGDVGRLGPTGQPVDNPTPTLCRVHRRNLLGDIFAETSSTPLGPSCKALHASMKAIQEAGRGAVIYLRPEGIGDELHNRLTALRRGFAPLDDAPDLKSASGIGASALPMHDREYGIGSQIVRDLGISKLRLLTTHARDLPSLDAFGLEIVEQVGLQLADKT